MRFVALCILLLGCAAAPPPAPRPVLRDGLQIGVSRPSPGEPLGSIAGRTVDADSGLPVLLATVVATSDQLPGLHYEFTDQEGRFTLGQLPPGSYDLLAIYGDVKVKVSGVPVASGATRVVSGRLRLPPTEEFHWVCPAPVIEWTTHQGERVDQGMLKNLPW